MSKCIRCKIADEVTRLGELKDAGLCGPCGKVLDRYCAIGERDRFMEPYRRRLSRVVSPTEARHRAWMRQMMNNALSNQVAPRPVAWMTPHGLFDQCGSQMTRWWP